MPEMATEVPKSSKATVSEPFSSAVCFQTAALLVNTYADPADLGICTHDSHGAETATDQPKLSVGHGCLRPSARPLCLQRRPQSLMNTYAPLPAPFAWIQHPTRMAVVPEMARPDIRLVLADCTSLQLGPVCSRPRRWFLGRRRHARPHHISVPSWLRRCGRADMARSRRKVVVGNSVREPPTRRTSVSRSAVLVNT